MPVLPTKVKSPTPALTNGLAAKLAAAPRLPHQPLWHGPYAAGPRGGVTQSMLARWLACHERFRIKYVLGLEPVEGWNRLTGFGNMWHVCEEALAKKKEEDKLSGWAIKLNEHCEELLTKYPMQREEISKWWNVCLTQFPVYIDYWAAHPDVVNRTPLMQEQVFDVPYQLPSGRVVRLRGKFDSVDLIDNGIWLQENKTKSEIDKLEIERQLKFDLQTMMYLVALDEMEETQEEEGPLPPYSIKGVRYNVVRRDLPIRKHKAKVTKARMSTSKKTPDKVLEPARSVPEETDEHFYARLRDDYIAANPEEWFFRVQSEVSALDIQKFKDTCLHPILEQLCDWYQSVVECKGIDITAGWYQNFRIPFGVYNALMESGRSEYDAFLENGSTAGMRQNDVLFPELQ